MPRLLRNTALLLAVALAAVACSPPADEAETSTGGTGDGKTAAAPAPVADENRRTAARLVAEADELAAAFDYPAAVARYREALALDRANAAAARGAHFSPVTKEAAQQADKKLKHGINLAYVKEFIKAYEAFKAARELDPNRLQIRFAVADVCLQIRRFHEAMDLYRQIIEDYPENVKARVNGAVAAQRASDDRSCLEFLANFDLIEQGAESDPKMRTFVPQMWYMRGIAARELHRLPEAIDSLERATRLKPQETDFYFQLGTTYLEAGKFDLAKRVFGIVLEREPDHRESLYNIGYACERLGDFAGAIPWYKKTLSRDKSMYRAAVHAARCFEAMGGNANYLKAVSYLEQAVAINPLAHEAFFTLQSVYRKLGRKDQARAYGIKYRRIREYSTSQEESLRLQNRRIATDPGDIEAHLAKIDVLVNFSHWEDAQHACQALLNADPTNYEGLWHMARLLNYHEDTVGAYHEGLKMIEIRPDDSRGYAIVAGALHGMKRFEEGLGYARKGFELDAADFASLSAYMVLMRAVGGHEQEIEKYRPLYQALQAKEEAKIRAMREADAKRRKELLGEPESGS